jgi:hypothetical protein
MQVCSFRQGLAAARALHPSGFSDDAVLPEATIILPYLCRNSKRNRQNKTAPPNMDGAVSDGF